MKTLLQLLLAQKLISSKCVLFQNNSLQGDTVPLIKRRYLNFLSHELNVNFATPGQANLPLVLIHSKQVGLSTGNIRGKVPIRPIASLP